MRVMAALLSFLVLSCMELAAASRVKRKLDLDSIAEDTALVKGTDNAISMFKNAPLVYNNCKMPLAVYLEAGILFNKQVIQPGEAVQLHSPSLGPTYIPYTIVALVGGESDLPSDMDSLLHLAGKMTVPTAFVAGVAVSVLTVGALTGPAAALAPLVSSVPAVAGYTIAAVNITAGVAAAASAEAAAEWLVKKHPKAFMAKMKWVWPGTNYFEVVGGPDAVSGQALAPLEIKGISTKQYSDYNVPMWKVKVCQDSSSQGHVGTRAFTIEGCGDPQVNGDWRVGPYHRGRPTYLPYTDVDLFIYWSQSRRVWRVTTMSHPGHTPLRHFVARRTFYESAANTATMPDSGWTTVDGIGDPPSPILAVAFTIENCGDPRLNGLWTQEGEHNGRPKYLPIDGDEDDEVTIQYSGERGVWHAVTTGGEDSFILYSGRSLGKDMPSFGWKAVEADDPPPDFHLSSSFHFKKTYTYAAALKGAQLD